MSTQGSKIYTRTGDDGSTSLGNGTRTSKSSVRVIATGDLDELNCYLGLVASKTEYADIRKMIEEVQHALLGVGSDVSANKIQFVQPDFSARIENMIDKLNREPGPLDSFILPGGSETAALCHIARAVCRRAERHLVELNSSDPVNEDVVSFMNRLSDWLFVTARVLNHRDACDEVRWDKATWR